MATDVRAARPETAIWQVVKGEVSAARKTKMAAGEGMTELAANGKPSKKPIVSMNDLFDSIDPEQNSR